MKKTGVKINRQEGSSIHQTSSTNPTLLSQTILYQKVPLTSLTSKTPLVEAA